MANVRLIAITKPTKDFAAETGCNTAEELISYAARVSNPKNQSNFDTADKLLKYCADNEHWSIFEQAHAVLEITTTRDISRQIIRHKTGAFQEMSGRYAEADLDSFVISEARLQDTKNRQNSIDITDNYLQEVWEHKQQNVITAATDAYDWAIKNNLAKEVARKVLPEGLTPTRLYMAAPIRTWITYINTRTDKSTQKEHREIANMCYDVLVAELPVMKTLVKTKIEPVIWHQQLKSNLSKLFGK